MTGEQMKRKIAANGLSITDVAKMIGSNQPKLSQSLSSNDIKTGLVEKIAVALDKPVSFFFDESNGNAVASGDYSAASVNGVASVRADCQDVLKEKVKALERLVSEKDKMIEEKERTINILLQK